MDTSRSIAKQSVTSEDKTKFHITSPNRPNETDCKHCLNCKCKKKEEHETKSS